MSDKKHTALPWEILDCSPTVDLISIISRDIKGMFVVARIRNEIKKSPLDGEDVANAELIVNAVNCHNDLLEALDYLMTQTVDMDLNHGIELTEGEQEARTKALAVFAKAKGGK
jgi:hypothetical protein